MGVWGVWVCGCVGVGSMCVWVCGEYGCVGSMCVWVCGEYVCVEKIVVAGTYNEIGTLDRGVWGYVGGGVAMWGDIWRGKRQGGRGGGEL